MLIVPCCVMHNSFALYIYISDLAHHHHQHLHRHHRHLCLHHHSPLPPHVQAPLHQLSANLWRWMGLQQHFHQQSQPGDIGTLPQKILPHYAPLVDDGSSLLLRSDSLNLLT